jgi:hypothetical protein
MGTSKHATYFQSKFGCNFGNFIPPVFLFLWIVAILSQNLKIILIEGLLA